MNSSSDNQHVVLEQKEKSVQNLRTFIVVACALDKMFSLSIPVRSKNNFHLSLFILIVCLFGLMLNVPVNRYGHIVTVSSPNHTFFLGKLD